MLFPVMCGSEFRREFFKRPICVIKEILRRRHFIDQYNTVTKQKTLVERKDIATSITSDRSVFLNSILVTSYSLDAQLNQIL
jgi:hypothetical protein